MHEEEVEEIHDFDMLGPATIWRIGLFFFASVITAFTDSPLAPIYLVWLVQFLPTILLGILIFTELKKLLQNNKNEKKILWSFSGIFFISTLISSGATFIFGFIISYFILIGITVSQRLRNKK